MRALRSRTALIVAGVGALVGIGAVLAFVVPGDEKRSDGSPSEAETPYLAVSTWPPSATPAPTCDNVPDFPLDERLIPLLTHRGQIYIAAGWPEHRSLTTMPAFDASIAGAQVGEIMWELDDVASHPCEANEEGGSNILLPGTRLHAIQGYREEFRVIAETPLGWFMFESMWRGGAATVGDLLDIRGRVTALSGVRLPAGAGETPLAWAVTDPVRVAELVAMILDEPVVAPSSGPLPNDLQAAVVFSLDDGTTVRRQFWASPQNRSGSPLIPVDQGFIASLVAFFEQHGTPVAPVDTMMVPR